MLENGGGEESEIFYYLPQSQGYLCNTEAVCGKLQCPKRVACMGCQVETFQITGR